MNLLSYKDRIRRVLTDDVKQQEFVRLKELGNNYLVNGQLEQAEDHYYRALEIFPESDVVYVNLGSLEIQKENYARSLQYFRKSVHFNKGNANGWVGLGITHRYYGDHDLALANIEQALECDATHLVARSLFFDWEEKKGEITKIINFFENFSDDNAFFYLAKCYLYLKQIKKAKFYLSQSIELGGVTEEKKNY